MYFRGYVNGRYVKPAVFLHQQIHRCINRNAAVQVLRRYSLYHPDEPGHDADNCMIKDGCGKLYDKRWMQKIV